MDLFEIPRKLFEELTADLDEQFDFNLEVTEWWSGHVPGVGSIEYTYFDSGQAYLMIESDEIGAAVVSLRANREPLSLVARFDWDRELSVEAAINFHETALRFLRRAEELLREVGA